MKHVFSGRMTRRTAALARKLRRDHRGVAAVEFAMIAPLMFFLFVGCIEFSQALTVDRRVTQAASACADLIARAPAAGLTVAEVDGQLRIIESLMRPYDSSRLNVKIVSVKAKDAGGGALQYVVDWSRDSTGATPYVRNSTYAAIPDGLLAAGESVIIAESTYNYAPLIMHYFLTSAFDLSEKFYLKPRNATCVPLPPEITNCI
ncbi:MAG: TadE/TadG family type IV pilus assembly protein [Hyphomicrobiaceae bacterium]